MINLIQIIHISLYIISNSVILSTLTSISWSGRMTGIQWNLADLIYNILDHWVYLIICLLSIQGKIDCACHHFIIFPVLIFMLFFHFILVSSLSSCSSFFTAYSVMSSLMIIMAIMFSISLFLILFFFFVSIWFPIFNFLLFILIVLLTAWSKCLKRIAL